MLVAVANGVSLNRPLAPEVSSHTLIAAFPTHLCAQNSTRQVHGFCQKLTPETLRKYIKLTSRGVWTVNKVVKFAGWWRRWVSPAHPTWRRKLLCLFSQSVLSQTACAWAVLCNAGTPISEYAASWRCGRLGPSPPVRHEPVRSGASVLVELRLESIHSFGGFVASMRQQ